MDLSQVSTRGFGTTWWREGYAPGEVDRFVNLLRRELAQETPELTAAQVEGTMFTAVRMSRGYRPRDVDHFLDEVAAYLRAREGRR